LKKRHRTHKVLNTALKIVAHLCAAHTGAKTLDQTWRPLKNQASNTTCSYFQNYAD